MKTMLTLLVTAALLAPGAVWAADAKPTAEKFYTTKCLSCHGKDGKGNEKMAKMFKVDPKELNLVDEGTLAEKDEDLIKEILEGEKKMPKFKDKLGGLDVKELVAYFRGLAPKKAK